MMIHNLFLNIIISYLVGSLSGSLLLGKLKGVDIRKSGSKNAGGTNAFRTQGFHFAICVVLIDISKGYISANYISTLKLIHLNQVNNSELSLLMCGFAAIIGHIYPIFYNFKGGKGAGTAVGMLFAIYPSSVLVAVISWLIILISTGYVGLSTIIGSITIPIQLQYSNHYFEYYHFFSIILSFLIIFTHHSNIKRMIQGNENQFKKVMVFKKLYNSS